MSKRARVRKALRPEKTSSHPGASIVPRWVFAPGIYPVRAIVWDQLRRERAEQEASHP